MFHVERPCCRLAGTRRPPADSSEGALVLVRSRLVRGVPRQAKEASTASAQRSPGADRGNSVASKGECSTWNIAANRFGQLGFLTTNRCESAVSTVDKREWKTKQDKLHASLADHFASRRWHGALSVATVASPVQSWQYARPPYGCGRKPAAAASRG